MIFAALTESASRGELILVENGFCRFHRRRDGVVVIHEILVLPFARRKGIASSMVLQVLTHANSSVVQALCPVEYAESNAFWRSQAFTLIQEKVTKKGTRVNLWQRLSHG